MRLYYLRSFHFHQEAEKTEIKVKVNQHEGSIIGIVSCTNRTAGSEEWGRPINHNFSLSTNGGQQARFVLV